MSGLVSVTADAVIASKAKVREATAAAEATAAKTAQGPTSAQMLMAHAEKEGEAIFAVQTHKEITLKTGGGPGSDLCRDYFAQDISSARDKGQLRIYQFQDNKIVLWHEGGKSPVTIWPSNIACTKPMGSA